MWIILLDHSGSMGEPFRGARTFEGRSVEAAAATKIASAKAAFVERLAGLRSTQVALFGFTQHAVLLYEGVSTDRDAIAESLDLMVAAGGTDIAAALDSVRSYVKEQAPRPPLVLLVISDGLSKREPAVAAAEALARSAAIIINVLLIDPTEEGEALARAICLNDGEVQAVTSSRELEDNVRSAAEAHAALAREIEDANEQVEAEQRQVAALRKEEVAFTAAHPAAIAPGTRRTLHLYVHLAHLAEDVRELIRTRVEPVERAPMMPSLAGATLALERGALLSLKPRLDGFDVNPLSLEVAWEEDVQSHTFRIRPRDETSGHRLGAVEVSIGGVLIGLVPVAIFVGAQTDDTRSWQTARIFQRVFASYTTADKAIVDACVESYRALGIYVFRDREDLKDKSGVAWRDHLRKGIRDSDLFQLYWSHASSQSPHVEDEWRYAHDLKASSKPNDFIRPLVWDLPPPPLPRELAPLHYARLDLANLIRPTAATASAVPRASKVATVIPLLPGVSTADCRDLEDDCATAVAFLEDTTGLRYYPAPTLIVDEQLVRSARRSSAVDAELRPDDVAEVAAWGLLLNQLALAVHVHFRQPRDEVWRALGRGSLIEVEPFREISSQFEWTLRALLSDLLLPLCLQWEDGGAQIGASLRRPGEAFAAYVLRHFDALAPVGELGALRTALADLAASTARGPVDDVGKNECIRALKRTFDHKLLRIADCIVATTEPTWPRCRDALAGVAAPGFRVTMSQRAFLEQRCGPCIRCSNAGSGTTASWYSSCCSSGAGRTSSAKPCRTPSTVRPSPSSAGRWRAPCAPSDRRSSASSPPGSGSRSTGRVTAPTCSSSPGPLTASSCPLERRCQWSCGAGRSSRRSPPS
jgi:hypothetical protein